jgi:dihydroorotase
MGLPKGVIAQGYDADLVIVGEPGEIRREKMHSKAGWTPYAGMQGIFPKMTLLRGEIVAEDKEITAKRGCGRAIPGRGFIGLKDEDD